VAKLLGDDLDVDACLQGDGRSAVAQVVKPDGREAAVDDEAAEALGHRVRLPGTAVGAYEEQAGVGPSRTGRELPLGPLGFVAAEDRDGVRVEDDVAVADSLFGFFCRGPRPSTAIWLTMLTSALSSRTSASSSPQASPRRGPR
jgi:hypothetical protein